MVAFEFGILLPFFLVLALVYGSLEISGTFKNRGVKALISVVLGFFAISSPDVVAFLYSVMPYVTFFFLGFFLLGFVLSFFKGKGDKDYAMIMVILALGVIFLAGQENINIINIEDQNFLGMIVVLAIVMILYSATKVKPEK